MIKVVQVVQRMCGGWLDEDVKNSKSTIGD